MSDILVECDRACLESMLNDLKAHRPQRIQQHNFIYSYLYHYDKINGDREAIHSDRWNVRFYAHRNGQRENCTLVTINGRRSLLSLLRMSDILVEYDRACLESMLNFLKAHLPQRIQQHNFIYSYLYHYDKINGDREAIHSDRWNVRFYTHRNGQLENCTLVTINGSRDYIIVCFTLQESGAELKECLQKTDLINWHNKPFNLLCDESLFETAKEVACQKLPIDWIYPPCEEVMYITKEKIAALPLIEDLPSDLCLAPLDHRQHAKIIDDHWHYKEENSLCLIRQSIELNGGVGLFRRGQSQPICWITTNEFFTPGFLYTLKPDRGRGYGQLVMTLELKRLLQMHATDLFSFVSVENKPSLGLHRKLGFETVGRVTWIEKPI